MSPEEAQMLMGAMQMVQGQKQASLGAISQVFPRFDNNHSGGQAVEAQGQGTAAAGAQNVSMGQEKKAQKKAEKEAKKKNGPWGTVGSIAGGAIGSVVPGVGTLAGAGIGSMIGGAGGSMAMGNDPYTALKYGVYNAPMGMQIGGGLANMPLQTSFGPNFQASPYI